MLRRMGLDSSKSYCMTQGGSLNLSKHQFSYLEDACMHVKLLQSCPTLCDSMDCSLPGSTVLGILQARLLEWVAMPSSRGSS